MTDQPEHPASPPAGHAVGFDADYETTRVASDAAFGRKMRWKRLLARLVGEVYVGKRVKLVYFRQWLTEIALRPSARALEVGSGDGLFSFALAAARPDVTVVGLELNAVEARVCQRVADDERVGNVRFVPGLLADHPWPATYDFVFCLDVLEHIADDVAALRQMLAVMRPGGDLLVHVPNRSVLGLDGVLRTVPDDQAWRINPGHVRNGYEPAELRSTLEAAGFEVLDVRQTQGRPIAKAHRLYRRFERPAWARVAILPLVDRWIRQDRRREWTHGNTVWAHARRPEAP